MMEDELKTKIRNELSKLNWIDVLNDAISSRSTSWVKNPVMEWRNASDEIYMSVIKHLGLMYFDSTKKEKVKDIKY